MLRTVLFCLLGLLVGGYAGFVAANNSAPAASLAPAPPRAANGAAPPLDPTQTSGELPANHPPMDGAPNPNDKSGGAASQPKVQQAMDEADRSPKNFDAQMTAAIAFYNNDSFAKAEAYVKRALAIKPNDVEALFGMGRIKDQQNDFAAARGFYEKALAQKPDPDAQTFLADTYFQQKDYARAIAEYRKALALDAKHEAAWEHLAAAALQKGDKTILREAVDKLTAINPQNAKLATLRQSL